LSASPLRGKIESSYQSKKRVVYNNDGSVHAVAPLCIAAVQLTPYKCTGSSTCSAIELSSAWPERCTQRDDAVGHSCCNQFPKHEAAATVNNHSADMWALPLGSRGPCVAVALGSKDCPAGTYRAEPGQRVNLRREVPRFDQLHRTLMPGCKLCDGGWSQRGSTTALRCCRHVDTRSERHVYTRPRRLTKGYQQICWLLLSRASEYELGSSASPCSSALLDTDVAVKHKTETCSYAEHVYASSYGLSNVRRHRACDAFAEQAAPLTQRHGEAALHNAQRMQMY
jgi:hypothetical protein